MKLKATIQGAQQLQKALEKLEEPVRKSINDGLKKSAFAIHETAVRSMQKISRGRRYGNHIASKPGDPPNIDTGKLVNSITFQVDTTSLRAAVGTNVDYGRDLEFGTLRILPRPWLGPAVAKNLRTLTKLFVLKGIKGGR